MRSLKSYIDRFDAQFPNYSDGPYEQVGTLIKLYAQKTSTTFVHREVFARAMALAEPLLAIRNFKSQAPFPQNLTLAIRTVAHICRTAVRQTKNDPIIGVHRTDLECLLRLEGFGLPMASAVLHFAHPTHFPIVDVNVVAGCRILKKRHPKDFLGMTTPAYVKRIMDKGKAGATDLEVDKIIVHYQKFIVFIRKVSQLQGDFTTRSDLRYVDKGLMVLGKKDLDARKAAKRGRDRPAA